MKTRSLPILASALGERWLRVTFGAPSNARRSGGKPNFSATHAKLVMHQEPTLVEKVSTKRRAAMPLTTRGRAKSYGKYARA